MLPINSAMQLAAGRVASGTSQGLNSKCNSTQLALLGQVHSIIPIWAIHVQQCLVPCATPWQKLAFPSRTQSGMRIRLQQIWQLCFSMQYRSRSMCCYTRELDGFIIHDKIQQMSHEKHLFSLRMLKSDLGESCTLHDLMGSWQL